LRAFVEHPDHSHLLGVSPPLVLWPRDKGLSASSLSPSRPCTPTFDGHSPAVGRCFHPSTWRIGVDGPQGGSSHLYGHTVVKVPANTPYMLTANFPAHPPRFRRTNRGAWFRANGSQSELLCRLYSFPGSTIAVLRAGLWAAVKWSKPTMHSSQPVQSPRGEGTV